MILGKIYLKNKPVALFVVIGGIIASAALGLEARGVKMLGDVPRGLPMPGLPAVHWEDINDLLPLALACFMLGAVETAAIGRMFCAKHGGRFDGNQELLALAGANLAAGLGRSFPVSGGMSQSLVNESSGARTPLSGLTAALIVVAIVLWFSGLLRDLPQPVLAAIVLAAVAGLINLTAIRRLWRFSGVEFSVAAFAFLGVLGEGILRGVAIGVLLSLFALLKRASAPNVVELGRVDGSNEFASITVDTPRTRIPGALIARIDGSLLYFNVEFTRDRLMEMLANHDGVTRVVLFLGAVPAVDLAGADLVIELHHALAARGIELRVAGAHTRVRTRLISAGADIAFAERYRSVPDALAAAA
jgi:MFS superfamily sulfate permease-like transporter